MKSISLRSPLGSLLVLVSSTVISLGLCEGVIRLVFPSFSPSIRRIKYVAETETEPRLGLKNFQQRHRHTSGEFDVVLRFNRYGFRDEKDLASSTSNDLFVVGDSFSMGYGVEERERYSNRLAEALKRDVYNITIGGTDFDGYARLLKYAQSHGATIHHVIIGVCMETDLRDYDHGAKQAVALSPQKTLARLKLLGERHSALYIACVNLFYTSRWLGSLAERLGLIKAYDRLDWYSKSIIDSSARRLVALAAPFEATVLIIPSRGLWVGQSAKTVGRAHQEFVALLRQHQMDVVDLRPYFEASENPMQYHFVRDGHWNRRGHAKAAEVLAVHFASQ